MRRCLLLLALVVGCSSSDNTGPHTGSLSVTVTAPSGITASVTITGPGGFTKTIASTTTLTVAPGTYKITTTDAATSDSVVGVAYHGTVTGSPAIVAVGNTAAVTVAYGSRLGSGALWVVGGTNVGPNTYSSAIQYTSAQLRTSSSVAPAVSLTFPQTSGANINANAVAFDAHGNLWVVNDNTNAVVEYAVADLGASGAPSPAVTIQPSHVGYVDAFAFDANGDLWVLNQDSSSVMEFTPSQLQASGSPTPNVTITIKDFSANEPGFPLAIAFDAQGSLWVVNATGSIAQYTTSQLATSATPTPAVSLRAPVAFPYYAAFDQAGNLWIANGEYENTTINGSDTTITMIPGSISEIPAASLATSGSASARLTWQLPAGGKYAAFPTALAFDASGDLWYTDAFNATVGEFTAAQISAGSQPSPKVSIVSTTPVTGTGLAFDPHTTAVPLH